MFQPHFEQLPGARIFAGAGPAVVAEAAQATGMDRAAVLEAVTRTLLVKKGVDWVNPILGEYMGLYADSLATFVPVWDSQSGQFAAHGALFQSARFPAVGLVAHIRTGERFQGRGLGTRVVEQVVRAGFANGAEVIALATDDKLLRLRQGERAANRLYSRIGFTVLAEKTLSDTVDWLMAIDRPVFEQVQQSRRGRGGRLPEPAPERVRKLQENLAASTRARLGRLGREHRIEPVRDGDLAALFLLLTLCPPEDFSLKLSAWDVHHGPELERSFVMRVRSALGDQDRLEDASLALREADGCIAAVCAASQEAPFTRRTFRMDFYCLPELLRRNAPAVRKLVRQTVRRIESSPGVSRPCRLAFWGLDEAKIALFQGLGFVPTGNKCPLFSPGGGLVFEAREFVRSLGTARE